MARRTTRFQANSALRFSCEMGKLWGQRLVAFKAPQGTKLPRITSDANGISAEFGFLLIKALIKYCSDHHEIGLNLGELNIDQIVITRHGPSHIFHCLWPVF